MRRFQRMAMVLQIREGRCLCLRLCRGSQAGPHVPGNQVSEHEYNDGRGIFEGAGLLANTKEGQGTLNGTTAGRTRGFVEVANSPTEPMHVGETWDRSIVSWRPAPRERR